MVSLFKTIPLLALVAVGLSAQTPRPPITFADHVAPIIRENCVVCHQPDGIGPFSLITYEQVRRRALQIAEVTASGYMPPWKPSHEHGPPLIGERRLTAAEIATLAHWQELGSPAGDLTRLPPLPPASGEWRLGPPDLIVELPTAYSLPAEGGDVYRNFAIPFPLDGTRYIRAVEFRPRTKLAIHHALLLLDHTGRARERDRAEPGAGYDGMGIGSGMPPSGHIIGWTPGQAPYEAYPGTAWEITPGTDLVLQLHMLPTGRDVPIAPQIGLYFSTEPPSLKSFVFQLRNFDIAIPAGESNYTIKEELTIPAPVKVLSLYPHAHYLGKDIQLYAMLPGGEKQWLLRIPEWDFNWQGDYRLQTPPSLPAGTVLHMSYTYDNSDKNPFNPASPPVDVRGGWSSRDEMAEAMIQVIPEDPGDLPRLVAAQRNYDIAMAGGEARYHYFNGLYLEQQGEFAQATVAFKEALKLDSTFASAYYKLGVLAEQATDLPSARELYEEALRHQPGMVSARLSLARFLMMDHRLDEAGELIAQTFADNPAHLLACLYLTRHLLSVGNHGRALAVFAENSAQFSASAQFQLEYGEALWRTGSLAEAKQRLTAATVIPPTRVDAEATGALTATRATAHYTMAVIHCEEGQFHLAAQSLDQCLVYSPDDFDALLLSAEVSLRIKDESQALARLTSLVSLLDANIFYGDDILSRLPLPAGPFVLVDAYRAAGNPAHAGQTIDLGVARLLKNGYTEEAARLRETRP